MRKVIVSYHHEGDSWWAESADVPGFTAAGSSLRDVRDLVREGLDFYLEGEPVRLLERTDSGVALNVESAVEVQMIGWWKAAAGAARGVAAEHGGIGVSISSGSVAVPA